MKNLLFKKAKVIILCIAVLTLFAAVGAGTSAAESPVTPKNIIFMIGDGMGPNQVAMARASNGSALYMEGMPYKGTVSTSNVYGDVTDSAAAGTALACGVKTKNGAVGIDKDGAILANIREYLARKGKKTGIISTVSITDATPATFGAHVPSRSNHASIANQFISIHSIDLILGGGGSNFSADLRRNAIQDKGYTLISKKNTLLSTKSKKVLGLFVEGDFPYKNEGYSEDIPNLEEMTKKGIQILNNENGFFLMSEGGAIDRAGHANNKENNIGETLEFDKAVKAALDFAKQDGKTLVIVTADHETGDLKFDESSGEYVFNSTGHSIADVPLYAYGVGANNFSGKMDNTDFYHKIVELHKSEITTTEKKASNTKKPLASTSKTSATGNQGSNNIALIVVSIVIAGVLVLGSSGFAIYKLVLKK